jgi:ribosomal protein L37AE/L43A
MDIHSELILALCQRDEKGEIPLVKIVGTANMEVRFEESMYLPAGNQPDYTAPLPPRGITPDIIVTILGTPKRKIAIEVESNIDFDVGKTLRQIKKYSRIFETKLIMPKEQEKYAPIFNNEGFRVYLWTATRIWECMKCGQKTYERTSIKPKCSNTKCAKTRTLRSIGLKEIELEEYSKLLQSPFKDRTA